MDRNNIIECGGFYFIHNFDSGNLGHVERVPTEFISPTVNPKTNVAETPDYEFNLWTRPDCAGTEFENGNRTWFYFGVQASEPNMQVRLNLINLNKQGKMYNQGMAPVTRTLPGKPHWERIRDRPVHSTDDNTFTLSFRYKTSENLKATTFFAFTYPYSYAELQIALNTIDLKMLPLPASQSPDDIYYCRECLIYSLEGRRVDLLTITSHHGITSEREDRLKSLFPENQERPFKFQNKKVIFISARVHPGETPSSFVFNGFLNLLLTRNDPIAMHLRKLYVFKMIPFLNPDGVARGHYRTDTRGVNLNRVYLNPSLIYHPTVFASRALIRYYHFGCEKEEDICEDSKSLTSCSIPNISEGSELIETKKKKGLRSPIHKSRDKAQANKSSAVFKHVSVESSRDQTPLNPLSGDATILAEQVYDMKLQEMPSQTSDLSLNQSYNIEASSSLLNEKVLKTCLGSNVHLTTSEDLNIHGTNPLKPLRDTLKNSISLLMESTSTSEEVPCGSGEARTGWCGACRRAAAALERSAPGLARRAPVYSASVINPESPTCHSIDEYREQQKQQIDDQETKLQDTELADSADNVYFCTNCFNRYIVRDKKNDSDAQVSGVSGDSGDTGDTCVSPGDILPTLPAIQPITVKEEKHKSTSNKVKKKPVVAPPPRPPKENDSGLYLYIDLHGHASKKGIFMYGNHFEDLESCVECMLLPRIMSLNNLHFHFSSCNFTERNMYLKDRRDGMSREGSGRVAVLKATGLVRSYTLECNYNTGRLVNVLPPAARDAPAPAPPAPSPPPKYTPHIFEEVRHYRAKNTEGFEEIDAMKVGRSLGASILDLTGQHPNSRVPCSEHRSLAAVRDWLRAHTRTLRPQVGRSLGASILDLTGQHPNSRVPCSEHRSLAAVRDWLRAHTRTLRPQLTMSRLRPKTSSPTRMPIYARSKAKVTDERKENAYVGAKTDAERKRSPPLLGQRSGHDIIALNMKFAKKNEPAKPTRPRYLSDNEPKPKTLATKRRNILAIRKPNAAKSVSKAKTGEPNQPAKLAKRSYSRCLRRRAVASSSSDDAPAATASLDSLAAKRRPFPNPPPAHLKKIRLKTAL